MPPLSRTPRVESDAGGLRGVRSYRPGMSLSEIEERVEGIDGADGVDFLYELLAAYGLPKASISRLRSGSYDKATSEDERLWKGKVWFRDAPGVADDDLYPLIDAARSDDLVEKLKPRFLIVRNERRLLASDMRTGATLDIGVGELEANASFFLPRSSISAWPATSTSSRASRRCSCRAPPHGFPPTPAATRASSQSSLPNDHQAAHHPA